MQQQRGCESKWFLMRGGSDIVSDDKRFYHRVPRSLYRTIVVYLLEIEKVV